MSEENKKLVLRWFEEVWNKGRLSAIPEMFHPSGLAYGFPDADSVVHGPDEFATHCEAFRSAFPDIHVTVDDIVAEGDKVAARWTAAMTHSGAGLGVPPSSKKVSVSGSSFVLCRDGRIFHGWNYADFTKMRLQLEGKL
jgi:steroid delta-isomerase-like uncharacterized protein